MVKKNHYTANISKIIKQLTEKFGLLSPQNKNLFHGGIWVLGSKIFNAFLLFIINIFLSRLLPPDEVGNYYIAMSVVAFSTTFALFGLPGTIVRVIGESIGNNDHGKAKKAASQTINLTIISSFIVAIIIFTGGGEFISSTLFQSANISKLVGFIALLTIGSALQTVIAEIFRGFQDIKLASIFEGVFTNIIYFIAIFFLWFLEDYSSLKHIFFIVILAYLVGVLTGYLILFRKVDNIPISSNSIKTKELFSISWPLWITGITYYILTKADIWILGAFQPPEQVAIYGLTLRLVALVAMPLMITNATTTPKMSELYFRGEKKKLEKLLRGSTTLAGISSGLLFIIFIIFGDEILGRAYGSFYSDGAIILIILSIGQLYNVLAGPCGLVLMQTGFQKKMMYITILSGFITLLISVFLARTVGGTGVALAISFGQILQNSVMLIYANHYVGITTHFNVRLIRQFLGTLQNK